jgi:tubulin-folding cofactor B
VLAWKKSQKLGRFDPNAPEIEKSKIDASFQEVEARGNFFRNPTMYRYHPTNTNTTVTGIKQGLRCRILPSNDHRRGVVAFVGEVPDIPSVGAWVGVTLDEPTGKNDGSVNGTKYFSCAPKCGVFLRAERVEVGDFPELSLDDELASDEEF